jgi:hypothetical protein
MTLIAELGAAQLVFMGAALLVTWILLSKTHRYLRQNSRPVPAPEGFGRRTAETPPGATAAAPPVETGAWEVQMHELARELSARLDSKMRALEQLTREADRAAARLEAALAATQPAATSRSTFSKAASAAREVLRGGNDFDAPPASQADGLKLGGGSPSSSVSSLESARAPAADGPSSDHRYDEIYLLADYGHSAAEIAQRLGSPIGEVELILSLRSKR